MFSFCGLIFYVVLELLRPSVLFPGVTAPIMAWVAGITAGICIIETLVSGRGFQSFPSTRFLAGFLVVGALSAALSGEGFDRALSTTLDLIKIVLMYLVLIHSVTTTRRLRLFRWVLIALILLLAIEGIAFTHGYDMPGFGWDDQHRLQYSGIFADSNDLGQLFTIGWALLFFGVVNDRGFGRRFGMFLCLVVTAWAIYLTESRGAILGASVGIALGLRKRMGVVMPAVLALGAVLVMHELGVARMNYLSTGDTSADGRIKSWAQGWYMLRSNPLLGVGPLNFTHHHPVAAHSSVVQVAAETGALGLFCWVGFLYFPLKETIQRIWHRRSESTDPPIVVQQLQAALLVLFVTGLFLSRGYMLLTYLLAGLLLCSQRFSEMEAAAASPETPETVRGISWLDLRYVVSAQMIFMLAWRFMARHYIEGI